jgi:hypothetical protein
MDGSVGPLAMDGAGLVAQVADRLLATFNRKTTDLVEFSRRAIRRRSRVGPVPCRLRWATSWAPGCCPVEICQSCP